jgi:uncharacterized phage protein (TIGR02220 family)
MPFVKLDCKILDKSIWRESAETCKVWITILAMADSDGLVEASIDGVSDRAKISLEETEMAMDKFMGPDPHSTNPNNDGRRIERVVGGFQILNYEVYRQKDYTAAARMRKHREALRVTGVTLHRVYASASDVLSYLNSKTGKKFKNTKYIEARLSEGYTVEQLKGVIDTKCCDRHFIENPQYMNPTTLFRPSHIDNYINQTPADFNRKSRRHEIRPNLPDPTPPPTPEQEREDEIAGLKRSISNAETFLASKKATAREREIVQGNLERDRAQLKEMGA